MDDDIKELSTAEIENKLREFPGWEFKDNKLIKTFKFKDFSDGLKFLNQLIPYCNKIDHHPDVHIYYQKWVFELTRYSVGGKVTDRDFKVVRRIEEILRSRNS